MNRPSLSAPIHSLTTLSSSKCMMLTTHSSTTRPVGVVRILRVRASECAPQNDLVARHDQFLDVETEIGKHFAVRQMAHLAAGPVPNGFTYVSP